MAFHWCLCSFQPSISSSWVSRMKRWTWNVPSSIPHKRGSFVPSQSIVVPKKRALPKRPLSSFLPRLHSPTIFSISLIAVDTTGGRIDWERQWPSPLLSHKRPLSLDHRPSGAIDWVGKSIGSEERENEEVIERGGRESYTGSFA